VHFRHFVEQIVAPAVQENRDRHLAAKTAPLAISEFVGRYSVNITGIMAGGILAVLPPIILVFLFQRYIISGMTAGAVEG
jgi:multiple sugar transport system permease protein